MAYTIYQVTIKKNCWILDLDRTEQLAVSFKFDNYSQVEAFIGSLVDGSDCVEIELKKKEVTE